MSGMVFFSNQDIVESNREGYGKCNGIRFICVALFFAFYFCISVWCGFLVVVQFIQVRQFFTKFGLCILFPEAAYTQVCLGYLNSFFASHSQNYLYRYKKTSLRQCHGDVRFYSTLWEPFYWFSDTKIINSLIETMGSGHLNWLDSWSLRKQSPPFLDKISKRRIVTRLFFIHYDHRSPCKA